MNFQLPCAPSYYKPRTLVQSQLRQFWYGYSYEGYPRPDNLHYWDDSNIYTAAKDTAEEQEADTASARFLVRKHFRNLIKFAIAGQPVKKVFAAGSIPLELQRLWSELSEQRVKVDLYNRHGHGEQGVPDKTLQLGMLADLFDFEPATAVLLTGDGAGYDRMVGFHNTLERMFLGGWRVEVRGPAIQKWVRELSIRIYHSIVRIFNNLFDTWRVAASHCQASRCTTIRPA